MGTSAFKAGAELIIDKKPAVLLRKLEGDIWQVEDERSKRITEYPLPQLQALYLAGNLVFPDCLPAIRKGGDKTRLLELPANDNDWEIAKIRRAYVHAIMGLPNSEQHLQPAILEVWSKLKQPRTIPGYVTVYRWKRKYIKSGKDIRALLPFHAQKGNNFNRYPVEVQQIVSDAIDSVYLKLERGTIQQTQEAAEIRVRRENKLRPQAMQLPLPTRRLVKRMVGEIPAFEQYAARCGHTAAVKCFRSVQAHRPTAAPLERAEIDHSPFDYMVIDDESFLPLGRPYYTTCIDDYTRCILGLHISFEPPSYLTVARCLKQVFLPKTELLKEHPDIKCSWNAHGVMYALVVDNGQEFHSISLENACFSLGIEIHYSPRKQAWFKGKIERHMQTMNRAIAPGTPGKTFSNIFEKGDYDPSKTAVIRYSVFKEIVYSWVVDVYHQQKHRALGVPPAVMWDSSIEPEDILVPDDPLRLDLMLGRSEERALTHKGIELDKLFYNSPELTALRRRLGDKLKVEVRIDDSNLGQIIVIAPDKKDAYRVPCLQFEYAAGLSEWQHRICKRFAAQEMDGYDPGAWLEAKARIQQLIQEELGMKKKRSRARVARFKNMETTPTNLPQTPLVQPPAPLPPPVQASRAPLPAARPLPTEPVVQAAPAPASRRITPLFRKRTPAAMAEERTDHAEGHDA